MNGYSFIKVEDLQYFGFDIKWNEYDKSLRISRNKSNEMSLQIASGFRYKPKNYGREQFKLTNSEIRTYIGNYSYEIESCGGIDGVTLINIDNLSAFGEVKWYPDISAIKVWIRDGLKIYDIPQYFPFDWSDVNFHDNISGGNTYNLYSYKLGDSYDIFIEFYDEKNGEITDCYAEDYNYSYFNDLIIYDSDGNVIYKGGYTRSKKSYFPYFLGITNVPMVNVIEIPILSIKQTAKGDGKGLIKFSFGYGKKVYVEHMVDNLLK
jgi:hypothetical protein